MKEWRWCLAGGGPGMFRSQRNHPQARHLFSFREKELGKLRKVE